MHLKKVLAVVLAIALFACVLPITVSAEGTPTVLYVGESQKTGDKLITKYETEGIVTVYSVKDVESFYRLTKEGSRYVLTFYNAYSMSGVVEKRKLCGLYCDGNLTVRLDITDEYAAKHPSQNANIVFDLNDQYFDYDLNSYTETSGAYGWYIDGTLTLECVNARSKAGVEASLTLNGDLAKSDDGNTGLYTKMLLMNNVTLIANGGNIGVDSSEAIAMIGATMKANTDARLCRGTERLFNFSFSTKNLIEIYSRIASKGTMKINAFYGDHSDNHEMEEDPHVYARTLGFINKSVSANWNTSFDLFEHPEIFPSCLKLVNPSGTAKRLFSSKTYNFNWVSINGNRATIRRPTPSAGVHLYLILECGQASYTIGDLTVQGVLRWWQYIPYFLSMNWLS